MNQENDSGCLRACELLNKLVEESRANQMAFRRAGLVGAITGILWPEGKESDSVVPESDLRSLLASMAQTLSRYGIEQNDFRTLFRSVVLKPQPDQLAEFLINSVDESTRIPAHIHFSMAPRGASSLEIESLGRPFPTPNTNGYTVAMWICIDVLDVKMHTTLFACHDQSRKSYVVLYVEKDTKTLVLQTALRSGSRFKEWTIEEGTWYHVAIVHYRPSGSTPSKAVLYVNGRQMEEVKQPFPADSPSGAPVQAYYGTPASISPELRKGIFKGEWSLGPAYLFDGGMPYELINLFYHLGPRYTGNYQDSLSSFQTYEASTALNRVLEAMPPSKAEKSPLMNAVKGKGAPAILERSIILNISAGNTVIDRNLLTRQAKRNLFSFEQKAGAGNVILNAAIPNPIEALTVRNGFGFLVNSPTVVLPTHIDAVAWKMAGCSASLNMIENAHTAEQVFIAIKFFFALIRRSWRNSDDVERCNGYEVLGQLLKEKAAGVITEDLLRLVLDFVGMRSTVTEMSVVNNPLAYRFLVLDFDIWRKGDIRTQKAHLEHFRILNSCGGALQQFNIKRFAKMHVVKKMLNVLKSRKLSPELSDDFFSTLKILVKVNFSTEVVRSLATFITHCFCQKSLRYRRKQPPRRNMTLGPTVRVNSPISAGEEPSLQHIGISVVELLTELICDPLDSTYCTKFATTITNKWPLLLLAEISPRCVIMGAKILARLFVSQGAQYVAKFASPKSNGFLMMKMHLRQHWQVSPLWMILICVLFGIDIAKVDLDEPIELYHLLESTQKKEGEPEVVYPEVFPTIAAMLKNSIASLVRERIEHESSALASPPSNTARPPNTRRRSRSAGSWMSEVSISQLKEPASSRPQDNGRMIQVLVQFFQNVHFNSASFRDFCASSLFLEKVLSILFPIICAADAVEPATELESRHSALTFDGEVVIDSLTGNRGRAPVIRPVSTSPSSSPKGARPATLRRTSLRREGSYVLVSEVKEERRGSPTKARLEPAMKTDTSREAPTVLDHSNRAVESLVELLLTIIIDAILGRKDYVELDTILPPSFAEYHVYFETYLKRNALAQLDNTLSLNMKQLCEVRTLTNVARFVQRSTDAVYQGFFLEGSEPLFEFVAKIIEFLQQPEVSSLRTVQICENSVFTLHKAFHRLTLWRLSELGDIHEHEQAATELLHRLLHYQQVLLSPINTDGNFLRLLCYHLYVLLVEGDRTVRLITSNIWRLLLLQKPVETSIILNQAKSLEYKQISAGFLRIMETDANSFLDWVDTHRHPLDTFFFTSMAEAWDAFVQSENRVSQEALKSRAIKRQTKLKEWIANDSVERESMARYDHSTAQWTRSIYDVEQVRFLKAAQDQADHTAFVDTKWTALSDTLTGPAGLLQVDGQPQSWRLDLTEGRNRMRKKLAPEKRGKSLKGLKPTPSTKASSQPVPESDRLLRSPDGSPPQSRRGTISELEDASSVNSGDQKNNDQFVQSPSGEPQEVRAEDDFEMVEDPRNEIEDDTVYEENKHRKVLRNLQPGDVVLDVANVSRIMGLEACEGLLLLGRHNVYLLDFYFQRSDGEIVDVWDAPQAERDPYLQMISGKESSSNASPSAGALGDTHEVRHWAYQDVVSVSKRQFLFRDVALEIFFADGRSYLITTLSVGQRNQLHAKLLHQALPFGTLNAKGLSSAEEEWVYDQNRGIASQLSMKFNNFFTGVQQNPATIRWQNREISNFHYLMLINTIAGRTYNDITQYPVFPWVLADYTSEELDLTDPTTFRDFSKPMGAQTPERRKDFEDRYEAFAEMDATSRPFHYGTHYSSAMIVCSYLIRLRPFVESYLLLQGGQFDHADRLFYSLEKAWLSASRESSTDVRELIPEFFYLPEFLDNSNGFDFGVLQGSGTSVSDVILPPWAKGDPRIFIQKHREALESEYVSAHLHEWVDLVFGSNQLGEAAIRTTNVFHHLSYQGAINLDKITDPVERLATIGIIHNFGQTPRQVFTRTHPPRQPDFAERSSTSLGRFEDNVTQLIQAFSPLRDLKQLTHSLTYLPQSDALVASTAGRIHISGDRYLNVGLADGSVRLIGPDINSMGARFEHLTEDRLTCVEFLGQRMMVTGDEGHVVCVWGLQTGKNTDIQLRECLRGHTGPITSLAVSKSFSFAVSGSTDETVIVWDLNRLRFIRKLQPRSGPITKVAINDVNGDILTCTKAALDLWTINGDHLARHLPGDDRADIVTSCIFYEGISNEHLHRDLLFTGHRGAIKIWTKELAETGDKWTLTPLHELKLHNRISNTPITEEVTAILPSGQARTLFVADRLGRLYIFNLPDTASTRHYVSEAASDICLVCKIQFGVIERRQNCSVCGVLMCGDCTIGTVCWCVQLVPQIWTNWRRKSTTGLSPWMLMLWAVAAPPYGIYAIVQQLNIPLQIQPQLFGILSLITWAQCLYYENKVASWKCWVYTIVLSALFGGIEAGCIVGLRIPYDNGVTWPITLIGVIAVVLIVAGLCPPYIDIWKHRSVRGISFYFLSIDMSGALFSLLSLVFQTFDILAAVNYILVLVMEIGIVLCHVGFIFRDRRRAKRDGTVKNDEETPTEGADIADVVTQEHEGHHPKAAHDREKAGVTA
ncbi:Beige protein-like 1 [Saitoella coloradoensis]